MHYFSAFQLQLVSISSKKWHLSSNQQQQLGVSSYTTNNYQGLVVTLLTTTSHYQLALVATIGGHYQLLVEVTSHNQYPLVVHSSHQLQLVTSNPLQGLLVLQKQSVIEWGPVPSISPLQGSMRVVRPRPTPAC